MKLNHLKNKKNAEYTIFFMNNELTNHLLDIDKQANEEQKFSLLKLERILSFQLFNPPYSNQMQIF